MKNRQYSSVSHLIVAVLGLFALAFTVFDFFVPYPIFGLGTLLIVIYFVVASMMDISAIGRLGNFIRRASAGEVTPAPDNLRELTPIASQLEPYFRDTGAKLREARAVREKAKELSESADRAITNLFSGAKEQRELLEQATDLARETDASIKKIASLVEILATSAEESSSSILEMTTINEEVSENMNVMGNSVRDTVSSITEMAHSTKEVANNIEALSETAEMTSTAVSEMDASIDQVQSNADETTRISEDVSRDAERGAEAVSKTQEAIHQIKDSSQVAVEVIFNLGQKIETIGQILNVIDDVAEQTNLLALNAAIIAAQAGDHGKGFAVVADEIKELAERSAVSTKEIAELIKTIQTESRNAIATVEQGNAVVDPGVKVSAEAEQALKQILESAQMSANMMRSIARATEEQSRGSKQVTDAIGQVAETVQQIALATSEQARGAELIIKGAEKMRSITQHVERSTQEQAKAGHQIGDSIESMSQMVGQVNQSHSKQHQSVEKIMDLFVHVDRISKTQRDDLDAVSRILGSFREVLKKNRAGS